jgi:hypothetical protein
MLCFSEDDFVRDKQDKGEAVFLVVLSDGSVVYQDDGRPNNEPHQTWFRLKSYLETTGKRICNLGIKFRSRVVWPLPSNQLGYFFSKAIMAIWDSKESLSMYLIGHLTTSGIRVQRWKVPELFLVDEVLRNQNQEETGSSLIRNNFDDQKLETGQA